MLYLKYQKKIYKANCDDAKNQLINLANQAVTDQGFVNLINSLDCQQAKTINLMQKTNPDCELFNIYWLYYN